ncbi:MAG TPA: ferrous iron transport protein B [Deltaproteobacteria bacterium]|nr:ferrous iron transport protein B [Deltaproteobacteria bacterium]
MTSGKPSQQGKRRFILVGNPNVGKSVIFGLFTGRYATVSNYPGTTVEVSRGLMGLPDGGEAELIDSPGVNTLIPTSEDERVTRDILLSTKADAILNVIDAKNLKRGLFVTLQLAEMGLPVVVALNMYDEAGERGIEIDLKRLSELIQTHVQPTIATQKWGVDKLKELLLQARMPSIAVIYPPEIERAVRTIEKILPEEMKAKRAVALMLLSGDETIEGFIKKILPDKELDRIKAIATGLEARYSEPLGYIINRERLKTVERIIRECVHIKERRVGGLAGEVLGRYSIHPFWGLFILAGVLFAMYEFVGVVGAGMVADFIEETIFGSYLNPWATRVVEALIPYEPLQAFLVGDYGIITMALTYAIAIVLPIVGFFFIFFGVLEDSGYLPRLAIMVDRVFKLIGLNGKAVLPMVLGLGCDTMATMTTRILSTRKERIIVTLLLALGVPCSAQLGVILGMLGALSLKATVVWAGVVVAVLFLVAFLSSKVVPGDTSDFILEIPPIRVPQLSNIALKTLVRVEWYLKEAVPLFILGTMVLFFMDRTGLLTLLEFYAEPVITGFLNLPAETTAAFIVGFLRRDYGAAGLYALQKEGVLEPVQVVVSLVTLTLFVPCIANFFMIIKERGLKIAIYMALFIFPFAILVGGVTNMVLRALGVQF